MNYYIFFLFYNLAHKSTFFDNLVIFFAVNFIYIVIALAFLFLIFYYKIFSSQNIINELLNKWKVFFALSVSGGVAWGLAKALKILIQTPRPFDAFSEVQPLFTETGYAFPSGHTMVAAAISFAIFFTNKKAGSVFMFFALIIGLARVAGGVHFPIDILGGFILGASVSYLVAYFLKKI